jgi:hypothetical protein
MPVCQSGGTTMGRAGILSLVFLLSNSLLLGQQQVTRQDEDSTWTHVRSAGTNCPIGVEASVVGLPSVSNAGSSINGQPTQRKGPSVEGQMFVQKVPPPTDYLQLHLDLSNPSSRDIVGAQFTAHGFSRKWRVIEPSDPSNAPDLWKTVDVALDVQGKGHASSELALSHFTAILTSIDLNSVAYADGTTWQAPSPGVCRIIPNMVMRIAAR